MKVHLIDETKSSIESLIPLCGKDLKLLKGKQFLTYPNQLHLVDCKECLEWFAKKDA